MGNLNGIRTIVTGANTGIGFETARALAKQGASVVLACRNEQRGTDAVTRIQQELPQAKVEFMELDLSSFDSIKAFSDAYLAVDQPLRVLINNAGIMVPPFRTTAEGIESQIGVNHFGHFALSARLMPRLLATPNSRIVNVSSIAHKQGRINFENLKGEKGYIGIREYGQSKLANLLFTFELHRRLKDHGVKDMRAVAAHPGVSQTDLMRHSTFMRVFAPLVTQNPDKGALPSLFAATHMDAFSGDYIGPDGFMEYRGHPKKVACSNRARSVELAQKLWNVSEELCGIKFSFDR
jgi:NAD(P)-dependent dehydrogenase (short-subunit alcohol dehydrogenase family)